MADRGFPVGGCAPVGGGGGVDLRCGNFSVKMYAKTKELGPIGGGVCPACPPPRSANGISIVVSDRIRFLSMVHKIPNINNLFGPNQIICLLTSNVCKSHKLSGTW